MTTKIESNRLADHAGCGYIRLSRIEVNDILYRAHISEDGKLVTDWDTAVEEIIEVKNERPYCGDCEMFLIPDDEDWLVSN